MKKQNEKTNPLLLTVGHNASAIFINKEGKAIGYEQEI